MTTQKSYIPDSVEKLLEEHEAEISERNLLEFHAGMAAMQVTQKLFLETRGAINTLNNQALSDESLTYLEIQRKIARIYSAGIIGLVGVKNAEYGRSVSSKRVRLADNHRVGGVNFGVVSTSLDNISIIPKGTQSHSKVHPDEITEGDATIFTGSISKPERRGKFGAWMGAKEFEDTQTLSKDRSYYTEPSQIIKVARSMLYAIQDRTLNPEFHTIGYLESYDQYLANRTRECAANKAPAKTIDVIRFLPGWMKVEIEQVKPSSI